MADRYEQTTQLKPAMWALAPVTLLAVLLIRTQNLGEITRSALLLMVAAGVHLILMRLVRDRGNDVQDRLWTEWGGSPTVQRLRWASNRPEDVRQLHRRVQAMTSVALPDASTEAGDIAAANDTYEDAVSRLRELTHNQEAYPRVNSELMGYGAARNLYGLKPVGVAIAGSVSILAASATGAALSGVTGWSWWPLAVAGAGSAVVASIWIIVITPSYVRRAADRYAYALLSTAHEPGIGAAENASS